jgi:hypothetical protein
MGIWQVIFQATIKREESLIFQLLPQITKANAH